MHCWQVRDGKDRQERKKASDGEDLNMPVPVGQPPEVGQDEDGQAAPDEINIGDLKIGEADIQLHVRRDERDDGKVPQHEDDGKKQSHALVGVAEDIAHHPERVALHQAAV